MGFAPITLLILIIILMYLSWYLFKILANVQVYSFAGYPVVKPSVHGIKHSIFGFLGIVFSLYLVRHN